MATNPTIERIVLGPFVVGDDPTVAFTVSRRNPTTKALERVDITGKLVEFVAKADPDHADTNALYTLSSEGTDPAITVTDATEGEGEVNLADCCDTAGTTYFRMYVADASAPTVGRRTFSAGRFPVESA